MPLPQLFQTLDRIPADKDLVFYCHSGSRSMVAASMAEEEAVTDRKIYNLAGGMLTWDGGVVADYPQVQLFGQLTSPVEMMKTAMDLEKGAMRFYTQAAARFDNHAWSKVFAQLASAEVTHAKKVHGFWLKFDGGGTQDKSFETLFESLSGDVLEGGMALDSALAKITTVANQACVRLVELALQIEYAAFDLYRNMADRITATEARQAFLSIAQSEKAHMAALAKALDGCQK
jgi:rubrerythrin